MELKLLESELLKLSTKDRALMTYKLLESLEGEEAGNFEEIWINEALNRYKQISEESRPVIDSDLVIREAKSKYK